MKTLQKLILTLIVVGLTSCYSQKTLVSAQSSSQISFQTFYNELAPYGQWVEDYDFGYMWIPHVNRDFHPYATNGYWTMTNYGNTWVSDYSWGWAPFHYGRWTFDDFLGWAWIPGYEWAPAWVNWRSGGGQYGWAPMGPRMRVNVNINIPWSHWTFLPQRHMYGRNMHRYYNRGNRNYYNQTTIINNTNIYNNNTYYSGPSPRDVERSSGRRVTVRNVTNSGRAGRTSVSNREVSVYRPEVSRTSGTNERPASAPARSSINRNTNTSGRTSTSSGRTTDSGTSGRTTTTPQRESGRSSGTVTTPTRRNEQQSTRSSGGTRGSTVNRSTEQRIPPARSTTGTVNRGNSSTQRATGSVSTTTTGRQNSSSTSSRVVSTPTKARSTVSTPTRSNATQATSGRSSTTNTRSNTGVSSSQSRSSSTHAATRGSGTTRSTSTRSGRGR